MKLSGVGQVQYSSSQISVSSISREAMLGEVSPPQAQESTREEAAPMGAAVGSPAKTTPAAPPPPLPVNDEEESQELRRVFRTVDADNDGCISRVELANFIKKLECSNLTEKQIDAILQVYDENGSGSLEYDEFLKLYASLMEEDDEVHDEELLRDVFNVFDANKDGLISPEELHLIMDNLNLGKGKKVFDFSQMIKAVDIDGDGFVDIKEFTRLMKRNLFSEEKSVA